jgi:hypothetical protein
MFKESEDKFTNRESGLNKAEALRWNDSLSHREAMQPSVYAVWRVVSSFFVSADFLSLDLEAAEVVVMA